MADLINIEGAGASTQAPTEQDCGHLTLEECVAADCAALFGQDAGKLGPRDVDFSERLGCGLHYADEQVTQ
jgi:hypothetical protein